VGAMRFDHRAQRFEEITVDFDGVDFGTGLDEGERQ